ncbi:MAG: sce7726 family protein [Agriterribacter sp.]
MAKRVEIKYPSLLADLFSSSFVQKIIENTHIPHLSGILQQTGFIHSIRPNSTTKSILKKVFYYLNDNYRCEYVYKTAILTEILLKDHSIEDTSYLTEFRAFNTKADVVLLNGTSVVYEIKSDLDNLERLSAQTSTYKKIFDKVFVISNWGNISRIKDIVDEGVGIASLNTDFSIKTFREAASNLDRLDRGLMFDCLRKPEYLSIIETYYGKSPNVPGTQIHSACKSLFTAIPLVLAHNYFVQTLKNRKLCNDQINLVRFVDKAFKCLVTEKNYSSKDCKLIKFGLSQVLIN